MKKDARKRFVAQLKAETRDLDTENVVDNRPVLTTEEAEIKLRALLGK